MADAFSNMARVVAFKQLNACCLCSLGHKYAGSQEIVLREMLDGFCHNFNGVEAILGIHSLFCVTIAVHPHQTIGRTIHQLQHDVLIYCHKIISDLLHAPCAPFDTIVLQPLT